jgi:hypothetical protein
LTRSDRTAASFLSFSCYFSLIFSSKIYFSLS